MTTITYLHPHGSASSSTSIIDRLPAPLARIVAAWQRRKTERMLEALPQEIRKDIGWPTTVSK